MSGDDLRGIYDPVTGEFHQIETPQNPEQEMRETDVLDTEHLESVPEDPEIKEPEIPVDSIPEESETYAETEEPDNTAETSAGDDQDEKEEPGEGSPDEKEITEEPMPGDEPGKEEKAAIPNEDIQAILYGIEALHKKFDLKVQKADGQETLTKTMYNELQEYKKGLYASIMKPLLLEMIQIRKNIIKQGTPLIEKDGQDALMKARTFLSYADDIMDVLEMYNVEVFQSETGEEFNPKTQKIIRRVPTSDQALDRRVAKVFSDGYRYEDRVIVKENVSVYSYEEPAQTDKEPVAES